MLFQETSQVVQRRTTIRRRVGSKFLDHRGDAPVLLDQLTDDARGFGDAGPEREDLLLLDGEVTGQVLVVERQHVLGLKVRVVRPELQLGPFALLKTNGQQEAIMMVPGHGDESGMSFRHIE